MAGSRREAENGPDPAARLREVLKKYAGGSGSAAGSPLDAYLRLLLKWNARLNLVGSNHWRILGPLFEEGLWAAGFYPAGAVHHLDIGSGAGFPALVLRIVTPEMRLDMVESRRRRAAFLETVVYELRIPDTAVFSHRLADHLESEAAGEGWDCVSWKGLKLGSKEFVRLAERCRPGALFWLFHAAELPLQEPGLADRHLRLVRCETFPPKPSWRLSIYRK